MNYILYYVVEIEKNERVTIERNVVEGGSILGLLGLFFIMSNLINLIVIFNHGNKIIKSQRKFENRIRHRK